jgi:predicted phage tail protein
LLNDLGERYGSEHKYFDLRSPAEAIKLLCINKPEFAKELAEAHKYGIAYTLVQADEFLDYDDLHLPLGKNDLILTPVVAGSGGGVGKVLLGIGIIAFAVVTAGAGLVPGLGLGFGLSTAISIGAVGASLVLSGIADIIAPQPVIPTLKDRTKPGQNTNATGPQGVSRATSGVQSYAFSGPANTVGVGATIPIVYGKVLIGSHLLSSEVSVASESDPTSSYFTAPGSSSITVNSEPVKYKFASLNGFRTRRYQSSQVRIEDDGDRRKAPNESILFRNNDVFKIGGLKDYGNSNDNRKNLQILLEIDNGFYRKIGSKNVPAFLTYEITVEKNKYSGKSPVFARVRGTIQGLLRSTDDYKWAHAITYGVGGKEDGDTEVEVRFRIINFDARDNQRIRIRGVGYDHFRDNDENRTEDLSDS